MTSTANVSMAQLQTPRTFPNQSGASQAQQRPAAAGSSFAHVMGKTLARAEPIALPSTPAPISGDHCMPKSRIGPEDCSGTKFGKPGREGCGGVLPVKGAGPHEGCGGVIIPKSGGVEDCGDGGLKSGASGCHGPDCDTPGSSSWVAEPTTAPSSTIDHAGRTEDQRPSAVEDRGTAFQVDADSWAAAAVRAAIAAQSAAALELGGRS